MKRWFLIFLTAVTVIFTCLRFFHIDQSPPGFYVDEAAGAAQVMCIKQTGADFFGSMFPLFAKGLGGGYYTSPFLYGESLWTSVWGDSVSAYRSFVAFVSSLTIFFLFLWVRKLFGVSIAVFATFGAAISPWVFQFSRIAWDPPLAPFFLVFGLFVLQKRHGLYLLFTSFLFALACYAYPPTRIQVFALIVFLPSLSRQEKIKIFLMTLLFLTPLFVFSFTDGSFTARAKMLAIWSDYPGSPFHDDSIMILPFDFLTQVFTHFSPQYLFIAGDANLRHSTGQFGILSWPEIFVLSSSLIALLVSRTFRASFLNILPRPVFLFLLAGLLSGIAGAALTWEGNPHALRSIGAWPFFAVLFGVGAHTLYRSYQKLFVPVYCFLATVFCFQFVQVFFNDYPVYAQAWFRDDDSPLGSAYRKMNLSARSCHDLRGRP